MCHESFVFEVIEENLEESSSTFDYENVQTGCCCWGCEGDLMHGTSC